MDDKARHIAVGITAMAGLVGVLVLLMLFGYLPAWAEGGYEIRVELTNASGLNQGSRVKLNGIDIGRVTSVELETPPRHGTVATVLIREEIQVPREARVRAESPLLGGSPTLAFELKNVSDGKSIGWLPVDGSAVIKGESLTMVSQFAGELQAAFSEPTYMMGKLVDQFESISTEWTRVGQNINELIEQRSPVDVESGEVAGNLSTVLARADMRLAELKPVIDGMDHLVNDPKLLDDLFSTTAAAREVASKLSLTADRATSMIEHADERFELLARRFVAVADDLSGVISHAGSAIRKVDSGEGAAGRFLNDPALYNNLNDCAVRLQSLLDETQLLIQKWKAEGLPVQF